MNESLFFIQTVMIVAFSLAALRLGSGALTAWIAVQALLANLFVLKQIVLFGMDVTASDTFAIGSLLGVSFLQEYFDREKARRATWICFFLMTFFALSSQIHLLYQPSSSDVTQAAFHLLLSPSPRLLVASMGVFFVVQQLDIRLFAFLKRRLQAAFWLRASLTLVATQLLDTALFTYIGLYGLVASVVHVIIVSFIIKMIVVGCLALVVRGANSFLKDWARENNE